MVRIHVVHGTKSPGTVHEAAAAADIALRNEKDANRGGDHRRIQLIRSRNEDLSRLWRGYEDKFPVPEDRCIGAVIQFFQLLAVTLRIKQFRFLWSCSLELPSSSRSRLIFIILFLQPSQN